MANPERATPARILTLDGGDLSHLMTLDRQYEAMWREYQSVEGDHLPTWDTAKRNFDAAQHQLAETVHQFLQREARPALSLANTCACGNTKRADVQCCLECADLYGALNHDNDSRDAMPPEAL